MKTKIKHILKVILVILVIFMLVGSYFFKYQAPTPQPVAPADFTGPTSEPSANGPTSAPTTSGPTTPPPAN